MCFPVRRGRTPSEGCWSLLYALLLPPPSCKGCEHKCSSRQFGRCMFCQICSATASRLVCYLCRRPCFKPEALGQPSQALKAFPLAAYKFQRRPENDPKMPPTDDKPPKVLPLTCDFPTLTFLPPLHAASFYSKKLWNDTQLLAVPSSSYS